MNGIVGLLLAAGFSRRYGRQKLLEPVSLDSRVAEMACRNLLAGTDRVIAVVRPEQTVLADALRMEGAEVIPFDQAHQGMGATLAFGVASSRDAPGWLIALADMPWIKVTTIQALAAALSSGRSLVIPAYRGQRGHPVGFGRLHYENLVRLKGDLGARNLLDDPATHSEWISFDDAGILFDIDVPDDLRRPSGLITH